ncbi:hypothetical protein EJ04DRAFT_221294 [Polyplosphaeria fusca]|uniref:Uncharacterized protein n=1 Tax=Polyplosphaeria fusca TaxID=682080 RepID=A0A9P4R176_9PLEO|nr:hypothetical protein EJ04DRAFT_221294 [Polyplosphaeria fusca]
MTGDQSLVLYRGSSSLGSSLATRSNPSALIPSHFFTQQTGTAIATELLYRLLIDIINRCLHHFQHFASQQLDNLSSYLERRSLERQKARLEAAAQAKVSGDGGLKIVEEVSKLVDEKEWEGAPWERNCVIGGEMGPRGPPRWMKGVLTGVKEGRMQARDFWIHTHGD